MYQQTMQDGNEQNSTENDDSNPDIVEAEFKDVE